MASNDSPQPFPVRDAVALVTGANRGIGRVLVAALLGRGAAKVYGGVRSPRTIDTPGVIPVPLDITNPGQVAAAADTCADVTLLVNNAGIFRGSPLLANPAGHDVRDEMETNFFGTLSMTRAFAPVLGRNGGGAIVSVLSVQSFIPYAGWGSYAASKAAALALSNAARDELAGQRTRVMSVHSAVIDTEMSAALVLPKIPAERFVEALLTGLEAGQREVLVDDLTRQTKSVLADYPAKRPPW